MSKQFLKDAVGWGIGLWLIGYILGIALFAFVPTSLIGWVISPIGILVTLWVLFKKISATQLMYYFCLGLVWTMIAIVADYFLLVQLFHPVDGYYKLDVYFYYTITFVLPMLVGWYKTRSSQP